MKISMILNGKKTEAEIDADMLLIDFVRSQIGRASCRERV